MNKYRALQLVFLLMCSISVRAEIAVDPEMRHVHDPSMIYADGYYYVYSTGGPIQMRRSSDLLDWDYLGNVLPAIPQWVKDKIQDSEGIVQDLWAPDVTYHNGKYYLCYSASLFGKDISLIGLLSNVTLDPYDSEYAWVDEGEIVDSPTGTNPQYNTIDGTFVRDENGDMWLVFGSYWEGIMLTPLDNTTLKPTTDPPTIHQLARRSNSTATEAAYITYRNGYYYLFVNWGSCCSGMESTYNIRVGRSSSITGPYVDKNGIPMLYDVGGTLFASTYGRWIGPGHADITTVGGQDYFSYHIYDGLYDGLATLHINEMSWGEDMWPVLGDSPQGPTIAHWDFEDGSPDVVMNDTGMIQQVGSQDISGHGFDMYAWNETYGPSFSQEGQTPSDVGLSARFNGGQDGYTLAALLNNWSPTEWTIELAVKLDHLNGWQTMIGRDGSSLLEAEADFYLQKNDIDNRFTVNIATVGGQRYVMNSDFVPVSNQWYYLAVVSDENALTMYADKLDGNGSQVVGTLSLNPANNNALATTGHSWTIGRGWHNGNLVDQITGNLDNIRFSDRALTPTEFLHYQCGAWGYLDNDFNTDCFVDLVDFSQFASAWDVSMETLVSFANDWLETTQPYAPEAVYSLD